MSTLAARPRPTVLTTMLSETVNAAKTLTMIRAALALGSPVRSEASRSRESRKIS